MQKGTTETSPITPTIKPKQVPANNISHNSEITPCFLIKPPYNLTLLKQLTFTNKKNKNLELFLETIF